MIKKKEADTADVIVAASSKDMNLYYLTHFLAGDPFIYIRSEGRSRLVMTDLEKGRAKDEARVDEILSFTEYRDRCVKAGIAEPLIADVLLEALKDLGIDSTRVPDDFPVGIADRLREGGIAVQPHPACMPFVPARVIKSEDEIGLMRRAMKANEEALAKGIDAIAASEIRKDMLYLEGKPLTSERIKEIIDGRLFSRRYLASSTIVAGGDQGCDPHNTGSGHLPAHKPIIIDVFPKSMDHRYCADMTRTVVRGEASPRVLEMYDAVLNAQKIAFERLRAGVDGAEIHAAIVDSFNRRGFETGPTTDGKMEGFFHGTGHGLGLDVHELPRFSKEKSILEAGMVVTVEPGLYYFGDGGMRLEDVVVIREEGCENICSFEKRLIAGGS